LSYFEASLDARIVATSAERALRVVEDRNLTHGRMAFLKGQ
jgi:hypothetical protein